MRRDNHLLNANNKTVFNIKFFFKQMIKQMITIDYKLFTRLSIQNWFIA